ncbi:hypothetical protein ACFX11_032400 [Malus domestica]
MAARRGRWWRVVTNEWAGVEVLPWLQQKELRDLNERLNRDVGRVNVGEVRGRDGVANSPWVFDDEPHIFHEDTAVDEDVKVALHDDILLCFHTHVIQEKESTDIMERAVGDNNQAIGDDMASNMAVEARLFVQ